MTKIKKTALLILLVGICLPTATLPFITEFKPVPELCLTSNFFQNMGNMIVVLGKNGTDGAATRAGAGFSPVTIPYRYLFSLGVVLVCSGLGILVVTSGDRACQKH